MTPDQQFTAIVALVSACFGGGISLIVSVVTMRINQKSERQKRELERVHNLRSKAFTGLIKLTTISNSLYSTKVHIEKSFEAVGEEGRKNADPCMIIKRIVGVRDDFPALEPDEFYFLVEAGEAELINEVILTEQRLRLNNAAVVQYNQLKEKLDDFIESHGKVEHEISELKFRISFAPEDAGFYRAQLATLNDLINTIMVNGERDFAESTEVVRRYQAIAERHFSDHGFPKVKIGEVPQNAFS